MVINDSCNFLFILNRRDHLRILGYPSYFIMSNSHSWYGINRGLGSVCRDCMLSHTSCTKTDSRHVFSIFSFGMIFSTFFPCLITLSIFLLSPQVGHHLPSTFTSSPYSFPYFFTLSYTLLLIQSQSIRPYSYSCHNCSNISLLPHHPNLTFPSFILNLVSVLNNHETIIQTRI